jgi:hypothetical protein
MNQGLGRARHRLRWIAAIWLVVQLAGGASVLARHDAACFTPPIGPRAPLTVLAPRCTCRVTGGEDVAALVSVFSYPGLPVLHGFATASVDRQGRKSLTSLAILDHHRSVESPPPRVIPTGSLPFTL